LPLTIDVAAGLVVAFVSLLALRPIANRWLVIQVANCWVTLRRFARGQVTWIDQATDVGARRLVAAARASELDELVVVGHSTGGVIAMELMARALKLDPDLGRRGPRLVLLTLGSVMPAVALHPSAARMRGVLKRLAIEPTLTWVDCQSRKDVMNFAHFDPVAGVGLHLGEQRRNPRVRLVRFRDMVSSKYYRRLRWHFFRMHFQYIMASDRQSPYDYILLVGGPGAITEWANRDEKPSLARVRSGMSGGEDARPRADDIAGATSRP
jgi:pimeloyl-ACP methyl ester carboxylesterase